MGTKHWKRAIELVVPALLLPGVALAPATAQVTELNGSAYGAFVKVGLFGGTPNQVGAAPVVVLPKTGGSETDSLPKLIAQFGPATIFGGQYEDPGRNPSGELTVSTKGKTGPGASVTSTASVVNTGPGPLITDKMSSTCTSDENGVRGSSTITKGIVETSYDTETQLAKTTEPIPEKPAPNTAIEGTIDHVGDKFRIVFNEQIIDGDTITVRAAHMYLLGQIAVGDMILGQSVCGLSADDGSTTPPTTAVDPNAPPITEAAATDTSTVTSDPELSARTTDAESDDGGGAGLLIGALAVAGVLGLATLFAVKRRRRPPTEPTPTP